MAIFKQLENYYIIFILYTSKWSLINPFSKVMLASFCFNGCDLTSGPNKIILDHYSRNLLEQSEDLMNCIKPGGLYVHQYAWSSSWNYFFVQLRDKIVRVCFKKTGFLKTITKNDKNDKIRYSIKALKCPTPTTGYFPVTYEYNADMETMLMYCDVYRTFNTADLSKNGIIPIKFNDSAWGERKSIQTSIFSIGTRVSDLSRINLFLDKYLINKYRFQLILNKINFNTKFYNSCYGTTPIYENKIYNVYKSDKSFNIIDSSGCAFLRLHPNNPIKAAYAQIDQGTLLIDQSGNKQKYIIQNYNTKIGDDWTYLGTDYNWKLTIMKPNESWTCTLLNRKSPTGKPEESWKVVGTEIIFYTDDSDIPIFANKITACYFFQARNFNLYPVDPYIAHITDASNNIVDKLYINRGMCVPSKIDCFSNIDIIYSNYDNICDNGVVPKLFCSTDIFIFFILFLLFTRIVDLSYSLSYYNTLLRKINKITGKEYLQFKHKIKNYDSKNTYTIKIGFSSKKQDIYGNFPTGASLNPLTYTWPNN